MPERPARLRATRARLYESLRSAHLERARTGTPVATVYRNRRYDFDIALAAGLEIVQASRVRAALLIARSPLQVLEINEPLMLSSIRTSAAALALLWLRRSVGKPGPEVVTYVIGNDDPFAASATGLRGRARRAIDRALARWVWHRLDRVAYGTDGAREIYRKVLGTPRRAEESSIPALPAALPGADASRDPHTIAFVGAFVPRKGIALVVEAWPLVVEAVPNATLRILGKGPLASVVGELAEADPRVSLVQDPAREEIFRTLLRSRLLVLPSQRIGGWREQVGLPIVEALSAGCSIVTTSETGLAPWLEERGHRIIPPGGTAAELAAALIAQLSSAPHPAEIAASLPDTDGRLQADAWMFATAAARDEVTA